MRIYANSLIPIKREIILAGNCIGSDCKFYMQIKTLLNANAG